MCTKHLLGLIRKTDAVFKNKSWAKMLKDWYEFCSDVILICPVSLQEETYRQNLIFPFTR